ncbi:hypothetical protein GGX14DRAFT_394508 [Mycena pura]|uniref:Uncharacterized protein n=1 Tax=Mycena pura TaxID=153505 RepID=A0AAD6VIW6_9AGAR|nr:hypothetical protein GGX14DRAFT_394508 [Mycena pura]
MNQLPLSERNARATSMGRVFLELLRIQHELEEPYDLGGDLLDDICDCNVVAHGLHVGVVAAEMLKWREPFGVHDPRVEFEEFKLSHILYDQPVYRRRAVSQNMQPHDQIPITLDRNATSNIWRYSRAAARRSAAEASDTAANGSEQRKNKRRRA